MILSTVDSSSGNAINHWTDFNACTLLCLCSLCVILQFYIPVLTEWRRNFAVYTVCMLILNSYRTIYQKDSVPNLVHIIILRHPVMADFGSKRAKFKVARLASVCLSEITHDDIQATVRSQPCTVTVVESLEWTSGSFAGLVCEWRGLSCLRAGLVSYSRSLC